MCNKFTKSVNTSFLMFYCKDSTISERSTMLRLFSVSKHLVQEETSHRTPLRAICKLTRCDGKEIRKQESTERAYTTNEAKHKDRRQNFVTSRSDSNSPSA